MAALAVVLNLEILSASTVGATTLSREPIGIIDGTQQSSSTVYNGGKVQPPLLAAAPQQQPEFAVAASYDDESDENDVSYFSDNNHPPIFCSKWMFLLSYSTQISLLLSYLPWRRKMTLSDMDLNLNSDFAAAKKCGEIRRCKKFGRSQQSHGDTSSDKPEHSLYDNSFKKATEDGWSASALPNGQRLRRLKRRHIPSKTVDFDVADDGKWFSAESDLKNTLEGEKGKHHSVIKYLREFGYLSESKIPTPRELHNAIRSFQDMIGVRPTGRLDQATLNLMTQPRCGNSDISKTRERRKRFVYISRWENKVRDNVLKLSWYIENYTKDIPRSDIKKTVRKAFHLWSSQVKISSMESLSLIFEEAESAESADITILWAEGDHGDAHKFDGPGLDGSNILAHTFYPNYQSRGTLNGDIHLDDYETWNVNNSKDGASFPHVLVHEIGHTLGLGHSKKQQAIMYPIYRKEQLELMQLDLDDKCAINWSYIGASDLCLYIWLLSEVLPKKIAIEKDATYMIEDDNNVWEEDETHKTNSGEPLRVMEVFERKLSQVRIPLCNEGNHVQSHLENMLIQRLTFPRQLAQQYSGILCRFFAGMKSQYNMPVTDNFHEVFRIHGVHTYFQDEEKFRSLESSGFQDRKFDAEFFQWLTKKFVK